MLNGIDLAVNPGEVLAIVSPSGSGKTTLLRSINLLETPNGGSIQVGDIIIDANPPLSGQKDQIRALAEELRTMVIVTHEMGFARDVAYRAIFMDEGNIVEQDPARDVFARPGHEHTRLFLNKFLGA